jgi:hypothetical protein
MTQDPNVIPWGAQDRFQAHFIIKTSGNVSEKDFLARTYLESEGHFALKHVRGLHWVGGHLADVLNSDNELKTMISRLPYNDAQIYIEPTKHGIRIHGGWKSSYDFAVTKELFSVYDAIASHIRGELGFPPV